MIEIIIAIEILILIVINGLLYYTLYNKIQSPKIPSIEPIIEPIVVNINKRKKSVKAKLLEPETNEEYEERMLIEELPDNIKVEVLEEKKREQKRKK